MARHLFGLLSIILLGWLVYKSLAMPIGASIICVSTTRLDVVLFLLENYIAHAGTTLATPGAKWFDAVLWKVVVVFIPFASLRYSMELMKGKLLSWKQTGKAPWKKEDPLRAALSREALIVVARSEDWKPITLRDPVTSSEDQEPGDKVYVKLPERFWEYAESNSGDEMGLAALEVAPCDKIDGKYRNIHGRMELPPGYCWSELKNDDEYLLPEEDTKINLSRSNSWLQSAVSIAQLVFSSVTLYRARGGQIDRYGYAAFGLSVFPYTLMSLINLAGTMILGEYPFMYVLNTTVLKEAARREGAMFDGYVGHLANKEVKEKQGDEYTAAFLWTESSAPKGSGTSENGCEILVVCVDGTRRRFKLTPPSLSNLPLQIYKFEAQSLTNEPNPSRRTFAVRIEFLWILDLIWQRVRIHFLGMLCPKVWQRITPFCPRFHRNSKKKQTGNQSKPLHPPNRRSREYIAWILTLLAEGTFVAVVTLLPYVVIYLMSGFRKHNSTPIERGWLMAWICVGQFFGATVVSINRSQFAKASSLRKIFLILVVLISVVSSVGGYIQVISMYLEFGSCSLPPS